MVHQEKDTYQRFRIDTNYDIGCGYLVLINRDNVNHSTFPMNMNNGLWYHTYENPTHMQESVNRMNDA